MFQANLIGVAHLTHRLLPHMLATGRGKIVNNASISGYAYFPAATTYAASKAGVVAERVPAAGAEGHRRRRPAPGHTRREHRHARCDRGCLRPPHRHSGWEKVDPAEWAAKVLEAIENDGHVLGPGGRTAIAKLASRGPASCSTRSARGCSAADRAPSRGTSVSAVSPAGAARHRASPAAPGPRRSGARRSPPRSRTGTCRQRRRKRSS